jgi:hypothetical protein
MGTRSGLALVLLTAASAWRCAPEAAPREPEPTGAAARLDEHRSFGAPIVVANLTVWPIRSDAPVDVGDFTTLQAAQAAGVAVVRERSDGAEVDELEIENRGDRPILVCAGTLVEGGEQDRQIGQDFVVAAGSTVPVDAFCVEPGRWEGESPEFVAADVIAPGKVRESGQYSGDQSKVWREVGTALGFCVSGPSSSSLFSLVNERDAESGRRRDEVERTLRARFDELLADAAGPAVVGFAYAVNGAPVAARAFAHPKLLAAQLGPFLKSMALEAELGEASGAEKRAAKLADVLALVNAAAAEDAEEQVVSTPAANENRYRKAARAASSRCTMSGSGTGSGSGIGAALGCVVTEDWSAR